MDIYTRKVSPRLLRFCQGMPRIASAFSAWITSGSIAKVESLSHLTRLPPGKVRYHVRGLVWEMTGDDEPEVDLSSVSLAVEGWCRKVPKRYRTEQCERAG